LLPGWRRSDAELRIWRVPQLLRGSSHEFKYALAYIVAGECVFRCDNEAGKGDQRISFELSQRSVTRER